MQFTTSVNSIAWGAIKSNRASNWKNAMDISAKVRNIVSELETGIVTFTFTKEDGTERTAKGTRNNDLIVSYGAKPLEAIDHAKKAVTYWDLDALGFRSFVPSRVTHAQ